MAQVALNLNLAAQLVLDVVLLQLALEEHLGREHGEAIAVRFDEAERRLGGAGPRPRGASLSQTEDNRNNEKTNNKKWNTP